MIGYIYFYKDYDRTEICKEFASEEDEYYLCQSIYGNTRKIPKCMVIKENGAEKYKEQELIKLIEKMQDRIIQLEYDMKEVKYHTHRHSAFSYKFNLR